MPAGCEPLLLASEDLFELVARRERDPSQVDDSDARFNRQRCIEDRLPEQRGRPCPQRSLRELWPSLLIQPLAKIRGRRLLLRKVLSQPAGCLSTAANRFRSAARSVS